MSYAVGQVLYLLSKKETKVFPVQVVEVVLRKTLEGEATSYAVSLPVKSGDIIDLDKIGADVFLTPQDLKVYMLKNAKNSIEGVVQRSCELARQLFPTSSVPTAEVLAEDQDEVEVITKVDLGNGMTANVDLSSIGGN